MKYRKEKNTHIFLVDNQLLAFTEKQYQELKKHFTKKGINDCGNCKHKDKELTERPCSECSRHTTNPLFNKWEAM